MTRQEKKDLREAARLISNLGDLYLETWTLPDGRVSKQSMRVVRLYKSLSDRLKEMAKKT